MNNINIKSWKKQSLKQYVLDADGSLTWLALFIMGAFVALLHQHLRIGLNIPGHHGLEWLTLLMIARLQSRHRRAGLMTASGAATAYLLQVSADPLVHSLMAAIFYLLNGAIVDELFRLAPKNLPVIIKGMVLGGVSFMAKPVLLIPVTILFGAEVGSIEKYGYFYPVLTHFLFGSIGAVCGICLVNLATTGTGKQKI